MLLDSIWRIRAAEEARHVGGRWRRDSRKARGQVVKGARELLRFTAVGRQQAALGCAGLRWAAAWEASTQAAAQWVHRLKTPHA
jgi:hypothetical protein